MYLSFNIWVLLNTEVLRPSWWWRIYPHPAPPCELVTSPLVSTLASYWSGEHHVDLLIGRFISHFCSLEWNADICLSNKILFFNKDFFGKKVWIYLLVMIIVRWLGNLNEGVKLLFITQSVRKKIIICADVFFIPKEFLRRWRPFQSLHSY